MTVIVLHVAHLNQDFRLFSAATVPAYLSATAVLKLRQVRIEFELGRATDPPASSAADNSRAHESVILFALVAALRRTTAIRGKIGLVVGTFQTVVGDDSNESIRLFLVSYRPITRALVIVVADMVAARGEQELLCGNAEPACSLRGLPEDHFLLQFGNEGSTASLGCLAVLRCTNATEPVLRGRGRRVLLELFARGNGDKLLALQVLTLSTIGHGRDIEEVTVALR